MDADTLSLEGIGERTLLTLLGMVYGELLERLDSYCDAGEGDPDGDKFGTVSPPVPAVLEDGLLLERQVEMMTLAFLYGGGDEDGLVVSRHGDPWLVGVTDLRRDLRKQSALLTRT